jgi:hypothetical protein
VKFTALLQIFIFSFSLFSCSSSHTDYCGTWKDAGDHYENILTLERIGDCIDCYRFKINSWRESYDPLIDDTTRFIGYMTDSIFTIEVKDGYAVYTDDKRDDGLYRPGEDRCVLRFTFDDLALSVTTEACSGVYSGYRVEFDGVYKKQK